MRFLPFRQLKPLEPDNQIYVHGKGRYKVQLEVHDGSGLTSNDIGRILSIASWEGGSIDNKVENYEGGRSVLITRETPYVSRGIELPGLQIAGVGYKEFERLDSGLVAASDLMRPPTTDNFLDYFADDDTQMATSVSSGGIITNKRQGYSPLGTYTEQRILHKVRNTRLAGTLPVSFSVPKVEAYGRYFNLSHEGQHMGFIVFTVPDVSMQRFAGQCHDDTVKNKVPHDQFIQYIGNVMGVVGRSLWDLHVTGYAHLQPHLSNFYYLGEDPNPSKHTIHLMDWSTLTPLGDGGDNVNNKSLDIRIVHQTFEKLFKDLYRVPTQDSSVISIRVLERLLNAYIGSSRPYITIDVMSFHKQLKDKRKREGKTDFTTDLDTIIGILRRELQRPSKTKS